jgi:G6PDH family F420-dependent oxidoreductase
LTLGVGTGEALNEHILGDRWPNEDIRLEMLEEAVDVIRQRWRGGSVDHRGEYYEVENARLYTLPDEPPPIYVSGFGPKATEVAGRIGDGYITTTPDKDLIAKFRDAGCCVIAGPGSTVSAATAAPSAATDRSAASREVSRSCCTAENVILWFWQCGVRGSNS